MSGTTNMSSVSVVGCMLLVVIVIAVVIALCRKSFLEKEVCV